MEKKKLLISSGGLKIGGLERLLVEYINFIENDNVYEVELFLMSDFGQKNTITDNVKKEIKIRYIKDSSLISKKEELKKNKKNLMGKLRYSRFLNYEKKITHKNYKTYLDELNDVEVVIDFDISLLKFQKEISGLKKIAFIHTSLEKYLKDEGIDIKKYGKKLDNYDKIIVISQDMKKEMTGLYPYLENKLELIYNSLDFENIIKKSNDASILNMEEKELLRKDYFLSVARLDSRHKDFMTLIKAYNLLKQQGIKEKLYIIGTGSGETEIKNIIKELSLEQDVLLLGAKQNPYIWMKNTKLFIHSSKFEGFGLVLIEAGILGNVIIASNCPVGPSEILENGKSGLLFETGNYFELAEKIKSVIDNNDLKEELRKNMAVSINRFRIENNLRKLYSIIENL